MEEKNFVLTEPFIRVDHLLQNMGIAQSGGKAGFFIRNGLVKVNGKVSVEKRKKVLLDDEINFDGQLLIRVKVPG